MKSEPKCGSVGSYKSSYSFSGQQVQKTHMELVKHKRRYCQVNSERDHLAYSCCILLGCALVSLATISGLSRAPWPPHCELGSRQIVKYLPFRKLQPPGDFKGFPVFSHSLPSRTRGVLLFLSTYWPHGILKR
jgi:hypothetical protein